MLADGVVVGPFCLVEGGARIGARTVLRSHVVIGPFTDLGEDNDVFARATLGMGPQDLSYRGSPTRLRIGHRNVIREGCTMHRGTEHGCGLTTVGDENLFMTGSHVAHDCQVGSHNCFKDSATLAGHVEMGDFCTVGAYSAVHQFCRVGSHAAMDSFTGASMDVMPYMRTAGVRDTRSCGVDAPGLRRCGFKEATIEALVRADHLLFHAGLLREEGLARAQEELGGISEVDALLRFIRASRRGIHRS
jgi:UDP-N-acetylglucosamine acyltransferase